jgi:transposase
MHDKRRWLPSWQRVELAEKVVLEGWSYREAAAWRHVSISTVSVWARRRRAASAQELRTGAWAQSRPSTPHRQPMLSSEEVHERVCEVRSRTGWGPRLIAS